MASTINATGSGIILTGSSSSALNLQVGGVTGIQIAAGGATTISNLTTTGSTISSGNLAFTGTAQRITGDFSNATIANRPMFQSSVTNGSSNIQALPNGTGTVAGLLAFGSSDPANSGFAAFQILNAGDTRITSGITGTGTYVPITFYTGGSERVRIDTSGNVGIGTSSPYNLAGYGGLSLNGSSGSIFSLFRNGTKEARVQVAGDGFSLISDGAFPILFKPNDTERMRIDSSGNVGIGLTPTYKLDVGATTGSNVIRVGGGNSGAADGGGVYVANNGTSVAAFGNYSNIIGGGYDASALLWATGNMRFVTAGGANVRMTIDTSGNVGIGTSSPSSPVAFVKVVDLSDATSSGYVVRGGGLSSEFGQSSGGAWLGTNGSNPLRFATNATERMRIDSSGNVAVGYNDATRGRFGVFNSQSDGAQTLANSGLLFGQSGGWAQAGIYPIGSAGFAGTLVFATSPSGSATWTPTERMRIDSSGNVGIGVTPTVNLDVKNAGGNCVISAQYGTGTKGQLIAASNEVQLKAFNGTNDVLTFATGASERMRITSAGNVGIGTTSPSTALQVNGTITTTGLTSSNTISGSINGNAATVTNGMYLNATQTSTVRKVFAGSQNVGTLQTGTGGLGGLELISNGVGDAAFMTFHKPGNFAAYFGIDTDNQFAVGGWSSGAGLSNFKCVGLGVGTPASGTAGEIRATNNITAYYSDARLKDFKGKIGDALYKVSQLNGYYYTENEKAEEFGFNNKELQVGVSAQEVKAILPEIIAPAPFDMDSENKSKSGEDYMTVRYEKLVPLLIEAIKELKAEVEALKAAK
jgi:hypothetical protein